MRFEPNVPIELPVPAVVVDAGLAVGDHRFRLVVVNQRGQRSAPVEVIVTIVRLRPLPIPLPIPVPDPRPTPIPRPGPIIRDPIG